MSSSSTSGEETVSHFRRALRRLLNVFRRQPGEPTREAGVEVQADIGDRVAAIKYLADTQGPWKALLEQVENAIDEYPPGYERKGPIEVRIVKRGRGSRIEISDRGRGFVPDDQGRPDLQGVVTRVAKSLKGRIKDYKGAQGEFAVGLFGFRTIGREMIIETTTDYAAYPHLAKDYGLKRKGLSPTYVMTVDADTLKARIERGEVQRRKAGTTVVIKKLRNARVWTAAKVKKAIEEELWDRLLEKGLTVRVRDNRNEFHVTPRERDFEGARFPVSALETPFGPLQVELYVLEKEDPKAAVSVLRGKEEGSGATRVYKRLTDMDEFRGAPWNLKRVQGWVRYDAAKLSGPNRAEFFQDERYLAFVKALQGVEDDLHNMVQVQDAQREKKALRRVLKTLRNDLERVCRELPHLDIFRIARDRSHALYISRPEGQSPPKKPSKRRKQPQPTSATRPRRRSLVGMPPPEFVTDGVSWRSRYSAGDHVVFVNKGHPDYERETVTHRRWYRYLLKLYTKELVLQCYEGTEEEAKLLEAAIEAQIRAEQDL